MGETDSKSAMIIEAAEIKYIFLGAPTENLGDKMAKLTKMLKAQSFAVTPYGKIIQCTDYQHGQLHMDEGDTRYNIELERRVDTRCIYYATLRYGTIIDTRVGSTVEPLRKLADLSKIEKILKNAFLK